MTTHLIEVTKQDIKTSQHRSAFRCAVAVAINRALGVQSSAGVTGKDVYLKHRGQTFNLPRSAHRFVRAYDANKKVKPFRFKLVLP